MRNAPRRLVLLLALLLPGAMLPVVAAAAEPAAAHGGIDRDRVPETGSVIVTRADGSHLPVEVADLAELRAVVDQVERTSGWVAVEPDPVVHAFGDPYLEYQWSRERLGVAVANEIATGDSVVVAVLDTGVDAGHEDLAGQVLEGYDIVADEAGGDHDPHGHGTLVAGMIAAVAGNDIGIAGAAPDVQILPVRVLDDEGAGKGSDITAGVNWAVEQGADVINLSLGGDSSPTGLEQAIEDAVDRGVVVVAAAGNEGHADNPTLYPGAYPATFTVGATDDADEIATWSSYGDHLDIAAPGVRVLSTVTVDGASAYTFWDGTSAATPLVSATAAMALEAAGENPRTADHVEAVLDSMTSTALDLGDPGWDPHYGHGLVQADLAVAAAADLDDQGQEEAEDHVVEDDGSAGGGSGDDGSEDDGSGDDGSGDDGGSDGDVEHAEGCPSTVPGGTFLDTVGTTFEHYIDCMVWWGITSGVSDTEFAPGRDVTRAQIATFLHRMLDESGLLPADAPRTSFADVQGGVHQEAIETLAGLGVINGVSSDEFAPSRPVTRAQMASLLVRLHEEVLGQRTAPASDGLSDIAGSPHEQNIRKLVTLEVTTGYPDGTYRPSRSVVRGQMAAFVMRYVDHLTSEGLTVPPGS